jgi:beta propeller repeat protein
VSGDLVVFQQKNAGGWNIYARDLATSTTIPICTKAGDQVLPRVDGRLIVWEDRRAGNADIYGYDLDAPGEFVICDDPREQRRPCVSGGWVVWQDHRGASWDVYGWSVGDAPGGVAVCDADKDQVDPDVDGDWVVWTDRRWGDRDVLGYNRVADYEFRACVDPADQDQPAVAGDTVVWRDARNAATLGSDIFAFDLTTSTERAVWSGPGAQSDPAVSGDLVLWTDAAMASSPAGVNVVGLDLAFDQTLWLARAKGWQGQPAVDGYVTAWGDTHSSPAGDLYGARLTPWSTNLRVTTTDGGTHWTRESEVRLEPRARSKGGIVTGMAVTEPGAAAVWEPYATTVTRYLSGADGVKRFDAQFKDLSGDTSPLATGSITLDTHGPSCSVPRAVTVAKGETVAITYRVNDNLAARAVVTMRIKNAAGATVEIMQIGSRPTGRALTRGYRCRLAAGAYKIVVTAVDLAGNVQAKVGENKLTVTE